MPASAGEWPRWWPASCTPSAPRSKCAASRPCRSVRERAEEKLYTRLGELRELAAGHGPDGGGRIVAVAGCVAQQEGAAILKRSGGIADVVLGTQAIRRLPMLVEQAAARPSAPI